ncbi:MAG TPA: ABC transporter permease [Acidobacteriaceae bacterium]|nr:ABC transporter permease [Acidobacteriaceae bacterium]
METLLQDVRYALRQLRKAPGFAIVAVLTLSLGAGAATAIFSVVDAVVLRPLPFSQPDRIFLPQTLSHEGYTQPFSWPSFQDFRAQSHVFAALSGVSSYQGVNLETPTGPVALRWVQGSDDFFDVFGVAPLLGRTYSPGEDQPGRNDVAVLSYDVWQTNFNGRKDVVGRTIDLNGHPYVCIGVMPAGFRYPLSARHAIYTPLHPDPQLLNRRGDHWLQTIGRLKPGISRAQAQVELNTVMANLGRAYPDTDGGRRLELIGLTEFVEGRVTGALWVLSAAVLAVLLIGCVNVAGLLLARGVRREREIALRAAVGANRRRLIRQILTESLLLAALGAAGGVGLAALLLAALRSFLVHALSRGADVQMNLIVLAAALAISVATSIAASLYPALRLSGADPNHALRSGGSAGTSRGQHRLRSVFIVSQVALSLALLVVAGVLLRVIAGYRATDVGFDARHVLAAEIDLSPARYQNHNAWADFYEPMLDRVAHLPGVRAAGVINLVPLQSWGWNSEIHITGQPPTPPNEVTLAEDRYVSPGYFDVMGIRLLSGRLLSPALDVPGNKSATIVVNQAFVKKFLPSGLNPVGQHLDDSDKADEKTHIAGVVTDVRQDLMEQPMPEMDYLYSEVPQDLAAGLLMQTNLVVRTDGDPHAVIPALREVFHQMDPTLPFRAPETIDEIIADQLVMQRMESWLFGIFAALAVVLALIGLYGLISHEVELGTRDIGIRMALGASRGGVAGLVLRRVSVLLAAGIVAGFALTWAAQRLIGSVVMIHFSHQAGLLALMALALASAGILAAVLPIRRAASVQPMEALRME